MHHSTLSKSQKVNRALSLPVIYCSKRIRNGRWSNGQFRQNLKLGSLLAGIAIKEKILEQPAPPPVRKARTRPVVIAMGVVSKPSKAKVTVKKARAAVH